MSKKYTILAVAVVILLVAGWYWNRPKNENSAVGAPGGLYLENYLSFLRLNSGINTQLGIDTESTFNADGATTLGSTLDVTATTTLTQSVDGLVVGGTISTAATGTVVTVYSNTTGPKMCDSSTGYLYAKNNGSFAPSLVWSLGTSTSAAASTNLIASSTIATTTTAYLTPNASLFLLADGDEITAIIGDITNAEASSTYFANNTAEAGVWCQDVSI